MHTQYEMSVDKITEHNKHERILILTREFLISIQKPQQPHLVQASPNT